MIKENLERLKKGEKPESLGSKIFTYVIAGILTFLLFGLLILAIGLLKS